MQTLNLNNRTSNALRASFGAKADDAQFLAGLTLAEIRGVNRMADSGIVRLAIALYSVYVKPAWVEKLGTLVNKWSEYDSEEDAEGDGYVCITTEYEPSEWEMLFKAAAQLHMGDIAFTVVSNKEGKRTLWRARAGCVIEDAEEEELVTV